MRVQRVDSVFDENYIIKIYELWNHQKKWPGDAHAHAYVQLWYVAKGCCTHEIAGTACQVNEGELFIVPPYVEHKISADKGACAVYGCDFPLEIISGDGLISPRTKKGGGNEMEDFISNILHVQGKHTLPKPLKQRVENIMRKMLIVYAKRQPYGLIELKGFLLRLLANIFQNSQSREAFADDTDLYADSINDAIAYINEHLAEHIYLEDVAKNVRMSVRSFNHYFKKQTGKTCVEYLNTVRLEVAKTLLTETRLKIADVGQRVGFEDATYFSRQFKKYVGCAPGAYRQNNQSMDKV